jgi:mevalonate pyrophosphate decarboxylase
MTTSKIVSLRVAFTVAAAAWYLTGCGLAETTAVAAAQAEAAAQQAKEGKKLEEKVQRDIEAANKATADALAKADEANQ